MLNFCLVLVTRGRRKRYKGKRQPWRRLSAARATRSTSLTFRLFVDFGSTGGGDNVVPDDVSGRNVVHKAPDPSFFRLNGTDERMLRAMKVLRRMFVLRRVAATDMPTFEAQTQMDPPVTGFHTFFTDVLIRTGEFDLIEMGTLRHKLSRSPAGQRQLRIAAPEVLCDVRRQFPC